MRRACQVHRFVCVNRRSIHPSQCLRLDNTRQQTPRTLSRVYGTSWMPTNSVNDAAMSTN
jgi:hypothetical protein